MFTGIVEETGKVEALQKTSSGISLALTASFTAQGLKPGDSLAVNGCCLTVVEIRDNALRFDLLGETWERTNLQFVSRGSLVNLERPLRADGRLDGHFVTGHIDAIGKISLWERAGADHVLEISPPADLMRYIVQ
ncbi:MAG TPA: riboflavin synthase, partial [Bryobacteraceae bacterium]|nr:riboflavin synthase [Bryobacteraceae bacterium]